MKTLITALIIFMVPLVVTGNEYEFKCKRLNEHLTRCVNKEVVCYIRNTGYAGGMSCKFK